jgi:hypothetical protein
MTNRIENDIILVDLNNKESIRTALQAFKDKVDNDELVLGSEDSYNICFMKSVDGKAERFTIADVKDMTFVKNILKLSEFECINAVEKHYYETFSNAVILNAALEYEDLKDDVLDLVKSILVFINESADTYDLWIDDEHTFGVDFLVAFILKYPEYTYLMSDYISYNWDDEHAPYVIYVMFELKALWGGKYDRNILKAMAYCKNTSAFLSLIDPYLCEGEKFSESGELFKFFKENPSEFDYFKQEFIQFVKDSQRAVRFSDGTSYVEFIIRSFCPELTAKQWRTEIFLDDTYENTVSDFEVDVDEVIVEDRREPIYSLDSPYEDDEEEDDEDDWDSNLDDEAYEEFFRKGFDNGELVWAYITEGTNPEVLDTIPTASLMQIAVTRDLKIKGRLDYFGADLDEFLTPILDRFFDEDDVTGDIFCKVNVLDITARETVLRVMDVLFRLGGNKPFDIYTTDILTTGYNICSLDIITERYQSDKIDDYLTNVIELLNPLLEKFMSRNQLDQIHELYKKHPEKWGEILSTIKQDRMDNIDPDILAVCPGMQNVELASGSQLLSVAYICYKEGAIFPDENITALVDFFENHFWNSILKEIKTYNNYDAEDIDKKIEEIKAYCIGPVDTAPPRDIMIKLMTGGPASLNEEEMKIFKVAQEASKPRPKEEITAIMEELYVGEDSAEYLGINDIELFASDEIHLLLASMVYAQRGLPMSFEKPLNRIFHLILDLAPCRTLHSVFKMFCPETVSSSADIIIMADYLDILDKLKVPLEYVMAWKITYTQNYFYKDEDMCVRIHNQILENYANLDTVDETQPRMWVAQERKEKEALKKCIQYLNTDNKDEFYKTLNDKYPNADYKKFIKEKFDKCLVKFCDSIIDRDADKPAWSLNDEEKLIYKLKSDNAFKLIHAYVFEGDSFEIIETELMPTLKEYICNELDQIIWEFDDEVKHNVLYMLGRFGHMNRICDYLRTWDENEKEIEITSDFFDLLIEIGLGAPYAFHFILREYQRTAKDYKFNENEFAQVFHSKYSEFDLYEEIKDIPNNLIIFALQQLSADVSFAPQMENFTNHIDRKVRDEANILLERLNKPIN